MQKNVGLKLIISLVFLQKQSSGSKILSLFSSKMLSGAADPSQEKTDMDWVISCNFHKKTLRAKFMQVKVLIKQ